MPNNQSLKIVVSGSLAYDQIMDFPGQFSDHILPDQIHQLNISFTLRRLRSSFGGTAGNIAYNLSLLKEKPTILGVVGFDFSNYRRWLEKCGLDLRQIAVDKKSLTAAAYIMTDQADNQIAGFYPGPHLVSYPQRAARLKNISLAIIAPEDKGRMLAYAKIYQQNQVPFIFDPGQMTIAFSAPELRQTIKGARVLIGNDYEINLIAKRLNKDIQSLAGLVEILVVTKGSQGSEIYQGSQKIRIKPAKPKNTSDPTGAGDAYRAGLIKGLINGYNLKTCGQLAGLVSVYTVEKYGTQTHHFSLKELQARYEQNFQERLRI